MFGSDFSSQSVAAEDHVGFDLCVLASSDHTVITYGTNLYPLYNNQPKFNNPLQAPSDCGGLSWQGET